MIAPTLRSFLHAVFIQRKVLLLMGSSLILMIIAREWIYAFLFPLISALGAIYQQKVLYRLEIEEDTVVLHQMGVKFPFELEQNQTWYPLKELYKVEYLPKEDHGQVHLLLNNSRTPSREYAVVPSAYWTERSVAIQAVAHAKTTHSSIRI